MAEKPDMPLFELLSDLLQQVESMSNQEEVELRAKIEALGLEVTKVPEQAPKHLDELEIAAELDKLSARLDNVDKMISSAMASDPEVKSLLSNTADIWMPVITASADERRELQEQVVRAARESKRILNSSLYMGLLGCVCFTLSASTFYMFI
ncbi:hypothetical protein EJB05_43905 [Eragrostis curvula]|uniref:Uncharacterized protein n=1 Tax=Eragrostis curvula TaxID=38414 RepID=A0A5J9TG92_9POAL|nr:hypothetical protein EJB05_43905 [Eragrostis curvula]